jgi:hypothetical protein
VSSGAPSPSYPTPNNGGKGKGKGKGKNNGSGNKNRGNNTLTWPSFYNPLTDTKSIWSGMCPPQQSACPPQHTLLAAPAYYGAPGGPSFVPLPWPPPH